MAISKTFYSILMAILLLPIAVQSQNIITLSQAINNGLANRKVIASGNLNIDIAELQTKVLYQKYWPRVTVDYNYRFNPILQTSILPIGIFNPAYPLDATENVQFGTKWSQSLGLTVVQPLVDISLNRQLHEAKLNEKIAALAQQTTALELTYTITETYINIYLDETKINTLIADTNRTYISVMLLKNQFEEKRLLKTDLNQAIINHNNTCQLLVDGIAHLIENKVYLLFLMGFDAIEKWEFEIDTNFTALQIDNNKLQQSGLENMPDLQQLKLLGQLQTLQAETEKAKHIPTIAFNGYLGANQFTNTFNPVAANSWFGISYVGIDVKVPIITGENSISKIQQFDVQANQYRLQSEDKTRAYSNDAHVATLKMENLAKQLVTQLTNINLTKESIVIYQAQVTEGKTAASALNLEESNLQLMEANYKYNQAQIWVYWLNYLKATGQLSILAE